MKVPSLLLVIVAGYCHAVQIMDLVKTFEPSKHIAKSVLSRQRRANSGIFEEIQGANAERECIEEQCDREELGEAVPDLDEANAMWKTLREQCWINACSPQGTEKCINTWNKRTCVCKAGWMHGSNGDCTVDINECETQCQGEFEACENFDGGFSCGCINGYELTEGVDGESHCTAIVFNACLEENWSVDSEGNPVQPCAEELICQPDGDSFTCEMAPTEAPTEAPTPKEEETEEPTAPVTTAFPTTTEEATTHFVPPQGTPEPPSDRICWPPACNVVDDIWVTGSTRCDENPCNFVDENGFKGGCQQGCHAFCDSDCNCHYQCRCDHGYELTCDYKTCMRI